MTSLELRPLTRLRNPLLALALAGITASAAPNPPPAAPAKKTYDPAGAVDAPPPSAGAPAAPAAAAAPAEEAKPDEKAEPAPPPPKKADPKLFDEALKDYFAKNPRVAAGKLFEYLRGTSRTEENYAWAQLFLAKSLLDLGLRHAGGVFLARIARERSNPAALPRALEELRALVEVPHDEAMIDEQIFGSLDLGFLPDEIGAFAHYQQGMIALKVGNERWAQNHFAKLPEDTPESSRAKFALLVTRLKDAREKDVIPQKVIDDFLELSKDPKLNQLTRNEAMLAVARLRYEKKDYEGALQAYAKVVLPPLDPGRASLYLEEAWTRYQLGQLHAALGILTTLDAPSFRDEFLPDKYLLRSMIFKDLCHYLPAKRAAKELNRRFGDSLEAIREREDLTKDLRLRRAASSHGSTERAARFLESLNLEGERISRFAGSFGEALVSYLTKLYDLEHAEATRLHQAKLMESVRVEADRLLRAAEQVRLQEYEIGLKLYERIKRGSKLVALIEEPPLAAEEVSFHFDGEYWNDELRDYRYSIQSRCIEDRAQ
jgi:hypothetical protein